MLLDRLTQLLAKYDRLYGVICRDPTPIDVELFAKLGYHIVWLDLEHSAQSPAEAVRLGRSITHLGMVPLVRLLEPSRTHVQVLLDGGIEILVSPDVRSVEEVRNLVELSKYPPIGRRGVSSTTARTGYALGTDSQKTLSELNDATHLMALIESDEGYRVLSEILKVEGLDMISVGQQDWGASLGVFGDESERQLRPKIESLVTAAAGAGKIVVSSVSSPRAAQHYYNLGSRVFMLGVDITIKQTAFAERMALFRDC